MPKKKKDLETIPVNEKAANTARGLYSQFQSYLAAVGEALNVPPGYTYDIGEGAFKKPKEE